MIHFLWTSFRTLWDLRNGQVHGNDSSTRAKKQKEKAHRELLAMYLLRDQTQYCDRNIFHESAAAHLDAQPVWALKNWIRVYRPLVVHSIKEAANQAIQKVRTLTSYFP
jgi:hypothetical protein